MINYDKVQDSIQVEYVISGEDDLLMPLNEQLIGLALGERVRPRVPDSIGSQS